MSSQEETADRVNRVATQHDSLAELIDALTAAKTLGFRDVTVTPVPVPGVEHLPSHWRYFLDATSLSARDALARSASLQSTRTVAS